MTNALSSAQHHDISYYERPDYNDDGLEESNQLYWNNNRAEYDTEQFPFAEWMLKRVQKMGVKVDSLQLLHEAATPTEIFSITKQLCADTHLPDFYKMVRDFTYEVLIPQGHLETPIAVQRYLNVRIMQPSRALGTFPFHTGLLYGHGQASRSVWMPLTDVSAPEDSTATMQMVSINDSRKMIGNAITQRMTVPEMTEYFSSACKPCSSKPGQVVLFSQENVHGNFLNVTGKTRVSIDFRLAEKRFGNQLGRKPAGGYFALMPRDAVAATEDKRNFDNGKPNTLYVANATDITEALPAHLQRYNLLDYAQKHNLDYNFEYFELEAMSHMPTMKYAVNEIKCNVLMYSIYSLPRNKQDRDEITDAAIRNGLNLHFVNEGLCIQNKEDQKHIEDVLAFAHYST